jgi:hypothetical protein
MRGVRRRPPPFGFDAEDPPPELGWRRKREILPLDVAEREVRMADVPALRFLRHARAPENSPPIEPTPPRKSHRRPPEGRAAPMHERPADATATQRQRLRRERQANGEVPVTVTINEVDWEVALTEAGFLSDPDPDKQALGRALSHMLAVLLRADVATLSRRDNR